MTKHQQTKHTCKQTRQQNRQAKPTPTITPNAYD